jgi:hypothetical protein
VDAVRAQTLAKFFNDRNGHGRGEVLVTSWACHVFLVMSCVLERVVPTPKVLYVCRRATAVTSCLNLWVTGNRHVCGSCKLRGPKKKMTKNLYHKILFNLSRATYYQEPDMRLVPVLSDYLVKLVILGSRAL